MPAGRTPTHTSLAISRGRERSRRLLITPRSGGLRTRQAYGSAALGRQRRSRQQHDEYDAQDKTHDAPPFLFASTRAGRVPDALRARAVPAKLVASLYIGWHRQVGRWSSQLRSARPICSASVSAPKAGRSINTNMAAWRGNVRPGPTARASTSAPRWRILSPQARARPPSNSPMSENKRCCNVTGVYGMQGRHRNAPADLSAHRL
jgi:hypothetical protein